MSLVTIQKNKFIICLSCPVEFSSECQTIKPMQLLWCYNLTLLNPFLPMYMILLLRNYQKKKIELVNILSERPCYSYITLGMIWSACPVYPKMDYRPEIWLVVHIVTFVSKWASVKVGSFKLQLIYII